MSLKDSIQLQNNVLEIVIDKHMLGKFLQNMIYSSYHI